MKHKVTTDPSTAYTGTVVDIERVEGQYGDQYKLTFEDGVEIYEKTDAVERQLTRLSLTPDDALLGQTLRFSRTPMKNDPSKGFLNIDVPRAGATSGARSANAPVRPMGVPTKQPHSAGPLVPGLDALDDFDLVNEPAKQDANLRAALAVPAPQRANAPAPVAAETPEAFATRYAAFLAAYVEHVVPIMEKIGIPVDASAVQAAFASFDIGNKHRGAR